MSGWARKYGYDDIQVFVQEARKKFSLVDTGIVDSPSCRLLLLNVYNYSPPAQLDVPYLMNV